MDCTTMMQDLGYAKCKSHFLQNMNLASKADITTSEKAFYIRIDERNRTIFFILLQISNDVDMIQFPDIYLAVGCFFYRVNAEDWITFLAFLPASGSSWVKIIA